MAEYFRTHFGKSWQMASYFRTCHELNASHASLTPALRTALPGGCNVKSMMVKNVPRTEQLYATTGEGQSQSVVFAPRSVEAGLCAMALYDDQDGTDAHAPTGQTLATDLSQAMAELLS